MSKTKVIYQCNSCGHTSSKWTGKCIECGDWNTISEQIISTQKKENLFNFKVNPPKSLNEISTNTTKRIQINDKEFNRVIGGGLVKGSVILIGGEPGIGKSTLTLKIALSLRETVLYVAGEESSEQIKMLSLIHI